MDVISDIVSLLRLRSSVYFHSSFCGSWAIDGSNPYPATFHLIARGNCWLHLTDKHTSIPLTGGDLVVFPRDVSHTISDSQVPPGKILSFPLPASPDETPTTSLICGYFDFDRAQINPLLDAMPDVLHIRNEAPERTSMMNQLLNFITIETENAAHGSESVVDRLTEILFIHIIRAFMLQSESDGGLLAALSDKKLSMAITAIHASPGQRWSLQQLAEQAGMSRASFARHFQQVTGITPMQYLAHWRMQLAHDALINTDDSVAMITDRSGYQTEASFRKAFKEIIGQTPGAVRKGR